MYLLYGLAFLIPSGFYNFEGVIIALLMIIWLVTKQFKLITKRTSLDAFLLPSFFLLYILSLLYTDNFSNGIKQITMHLSYILIPLVFITNMIDEKVKERILMVFLSSTLLFLAIADVYAIIDILRTESYIVRIATGDYYKFLSYGLTRIFTDWHPTIVSLFLIFSLVITVKYLFNDKKQYAIPILIFIVLNIFLLKSLIGILCLLMVISIFLLSLINKNTYKFALVFITLGLAIAFYVFNPFKVDKIQRFKKTNIEITDDEDRRNVLSIRLVKWSSTLNLFKENILLGVSPGDLKQNLITEYTENGFYFAAEKKFGPHNQFLQILAALGIIGLLVFLTVIFLPYFKLVEINSLYSWFLLIILIFFLTEDVLERQQGIVFFSFFYTMLLSQTKKL
jgi:O-antigen ligase